MICSVFRLIRTEICRNLAFLFISLIVLNKISTFLFNTNDILNIFCIIECAGELKCSNLFIVTMNEERVIEKNGYKVKVLPIYKF